MGWELKFWTAKFRILDISNLKINECENVNGRIYKSHYNRKWKLRTQSVEIHSYQRANMKISKIASAEYRMDEKFQNLLNGISVVFQIEKILKICYS